MKTCAVCAKPVNDSSVLMGGVLLCRSCEPNVKAKIEQLHAEGKPVNVSQIAREMFRKQYSAGSYLLRDIPEELWITAKHKAVDKGMNLRELILDAIREYINK